MHPYTHAGMDMGRHISGTSFNFNVDSRLPSTLHIQLYTYIQSHKPRSHVTQHEARDWVNQCPSDDLPICVCSQRMNYRGRRGGCGSATTTMRRPGEVRRLLRHDGERAAGRCGGSRRRRWLPARRPRMAAQLPRLQQDRVAAAAAAMTAGRCRRGGGGRLVGGPAGVAGAVVAVVFHSTTRDDRGV